MCCEIFDEAFSCFPQAVYNSITLILFDCLDMKLNILNSFQKTLFVHCWLFVSIFIAAHKGWVRLLSACVNKWTESHKIWKVWTLINQVIIWCFPSHGVWLKSQIIKPTGISETVNINQLLWMNQFQPIEA